MPPGAAVEVSVCPPLKGNSYSQAVLCESVEASHGDRRVTQEVSSALEMSSGYVRLDGQCKYAVVGAGTFLVPSVILSYLSPSIVIISSLA